ncbi:MAG: hypothetical protein KKD18_00070 [Nanoarchaeota archaeon]|nr:hypothetical protein [Nanoarchaeota archaeon]MBU0976793.1 hypothetical protein [Nanoarchaeota archaeon]
MDWQKELNKIRFFDKPRRSSSKESNSVYFGWNRQKDKTTALQYLPPNSKTSKHFHKKLEEEYHVLAGKCTVLKGNKQIKLTKKLRIRKKEPHQLKTGKEGCLMLLEIIHKNRPSWQKDKITL